MPHDVFISHSSIDKAAADTVCALLEADGIRCWIAPRDVQAGVSYAGSIIDAINASKAMVLIFSGAANASPQIEREIERAANHRLPILPFRIENVAPEKGLEYFLSTPHWLDAFTPPLDAHVRDLAKQLKALLGKTEVVGPRPSDAAVAVAPAAVTAAAAPVSLPAAKKTPSRGLIAAAVVVGVGGVAAAATGTIWWTGQHHAAAPSRRRRPPRPRPQPRAVRGRQASAPRHQPRSPRATSPAPRPPQPRRTPPRLTPQSPTRTRWRRRRGSWPAIAWASAALCRRGGACDTASAENSDLCYPFMRWGLTANCLLRRGAAKTGRRLGS